MKKILLLLCLMALFCGPVFAQEQTQQEPTAEKPAETKAPDKPVKIDAELTGALIDQRMYSWYIETISTSAGKMTIPVSLKDAQQALQVKRQAILNWLKKNNVPPDWVISQDGEYLIPPVVANSKPPKEEQPKKP